MTIPVFRFAPSPNGRLHLGHAYSALLNADFATRWDGRLLLRIEDIDVARCRPEFVAAITDDLSWLGLRWEQPVRRQSHHGDDYQAAFSVLRSQDLLYPCFCSRKALAADVARGAAATGGPPPRDPDGAARYPGTCSRLSATEVSARLASGEPHAWRLRMKAALAQVPIGLEFQAFDCDGATTAHGVDPQAWGDAIVVRRDIPTSYHLSVVVDDALQGITHVVRGQDLEAATDLHVVLQTVLGLPTPCYHHHALIRDGGGEKLAKSRMSETLMALRQQGVTAADIRRRLGFA